jgi:hypothetical protein
MYLFLYMILLVFVLHVFLPVELPEMDVKSIKPSGCLIIEPELCLGSEDHCPRLVALVIPLLIVE